MKLIVFTLLCIANFLAHAQNTMLSYQDSALAADFKNVFWEVAYGQNGPDSNGLDPAYHNYLNKFIAVLQDKNSLGYPFPYMARYIKITSSPDGQLRYFQWNTQRSERLNVTATIIQATVNGRPYIIRNDTIGPNETPAYYDVTGIYQVKVDTQKIYIIADFESYGAGIAGTTISAGTITKNGVCFNYPLFYIDSPVAHISNSYYRIKTWELRKAVEVKYNMRHKTLTYTASYDDDVQEIGSRTHKDGAHEIIEIKFDGKVFRPHRKYIKDEPRFKWQKRICWR